MNNPAILLVRKCTYFGYFLFNSYNDSTSRILKIKQAFGKLSSRKISSLVLIERIIYKLFVCKNVLFQFDGLLSEFDHQDINIRYIIFTLIHVVVVPSFIQRVPLSYPISNLKFNFIKIINVKVAGCSLCVCLPVSKSH